MIDDAIIKVAKELDELKEERVEYTVNNIAYKYEIECLKKEKKQLQNNWNELNKFVEEEKNRLATQVSNTYKDSLDKIHFVNEDIFNELTKVSEKMQELEQGKDE